MNILELSLKDLQELINNATLVQKNGAESELATQHQETTNSIAKNDLFGKIKGEIKRQHVSYVDLSRLIGRTPQYLCNAFSGRAELRLKECWEILTHLGLPEEEFFIYFPNARK